MSAFHDSTPSQTWARTRRGARSRAWRPACQAARAITQTAAEVRATRVSTADQQKTGGRCKRKKAHEQPLTTLASRGRLLRKTGVHYLTLVLIAVILLWLYTRALAFGLALWWGAA
jgi:hypothetical protein